MNAIKNEKVALITGAARGIGAVVASRLAADGFAIAVNYASSATEAEALVAELRQDGATAIAVKADVANPVDVRHMFDTVENELGKVDVLVNNAGVMKVVPLHDTTDESFEQTMNTNVRGTFNTMREAWSRIAEGGRIINFSSTSLGLNKPGYALYNASKGAVEAMSRVFAQELRGRNVTVNAVAPGPVGTDLFYKGKTEEQIQAFANIPPLQRLGRADEIAAVVSFLAGPDGGWVNGQVLRANGGAA
ncbi:SDR family oxidoreductase [Paraburkholderia solisilvae]|uniref:3-oxoacyl-[acyl-carrier-protein] reductase FabG n=1 Tax=Paraburkholderia solisilvae TaxID=624376 RepID=A0A6J5DK93_9BURK|nr:SDR family oxidoreductase [Paraburkholderia solisilvae]CAB3753632.1 3-oxoacyl-[acyl-carrier-protein] reductase FabG [Paraburkholderia solisilvae]